MRILLETARRLQDLCEAAGLRFCIIGGLAVERWGEMRITNDVDATIYTAVADDMRVIDYLLQHFRARREDARMFAKIHRVLLISDPKREIGVDISLGAMDFEARAIDRSSVFQYQPNIALRTCSAEDLIVFKAFAGRDHDWLDIKGILIRQQGKLDFHLIEQELPPLVMLKEEPEILARWASLRERYR